MASNSLPDTAPACKTCRFFVVWQSTCHRYPPIYASATAWPAWKWPHVTKRDWCGEYMESEQV